jgi:hypothetical protein
VTVYKQFTLWLEYNIMWLYCNLYVILKRDLVVAVGRSLSLNFVVNSLVES